jgi:hypothetical protein
MDKFTLATLIVLLVVFAAVIVPKLYLRWRIARSLRRMTQTIQITSGSFIVLANATREAGDALFSEIIKVYEQEDAHEQ